MASLPLNMLNVVTFTWTVVKFCGASFLLKLFKNKNDILVGAYYRTPDSYKPETPRGLEESLQKLKSIVRVPFIVLGGDFNIPGMEWKVGDVTYPINRIQSEILNIAQGYNLDQKVDFPTRKDLVTGVENILDLLFTTRPRTFIQILDLEITQLLWQMYTCKRQRL